GAAALRDFTSSSATRAHSPTVIRNDDLSSFPKVAVDLSQFLGCPAFVLASLSSLASTWTVSVSRLVFRSSVKTVRDTLHSKNGICRPPLKEITARATG